MLDILVIGAGVTGCAAARWLSRYDLRIAVADAAADVAMGASRANSAIVHAGYDCEPGSNMARMNVEGNRLYDSWCEDLNVPLKRCGSLVLAFGDDDMMHVRELYDRGVTNGVPALRILSAEETHAMQPGLNPEIVGALYAGTGGITCPYEMTQACARNAALNGVDFYLNWKVNAIEAQSDGSLLVSSESGETLHARYVINAAGLYADEVARLAGDDSISIHARKGEYMLIDRASGSAVRTILFQTPGALGKGVLVAPTVDGNCFAGPSASDQESKDDTSVTSEGLAFLRMHAARTMPDFPFYKVITSFAGLRAVEKGYDFILGPSKAQPRMIHAAGICSPGLTSAPAIAVYLADCLRNAGLPMAEKADWNRSVPHIRPLREMDDAQREAAIAENPLYARVICRCETVSEAEIVQAIRQSPGATTLDGVKRRTRAGMGRCQGGFCSPRVMEILSRELGVPMTEITKFGGGSNMLVGPLRAKEES